MTDAVPPGHARDSDIGAAVLFILRQQGVAVPRDRISLSRLGWRVRRMVEQARAPEGRP